ncbi:MAG: hypothetical protein DMG81_04315 [Acidobacteria bacterium]|nr:MAG: hypothetical protein DMG81_04315 [Acidobacteriota bacterium]
MSLAGNRGSKEREDGLFAPALLFSGKFPGSAGGPTKWGILSDYRLLNTRTLKSEWEYFQGSRIDFWFTKFF